MVAEFFLRQLQVHESVQINGIALDIGRIHRGSRGSISQITGRFAKIESLEPRLNLLPKALAVCVEICFVGDFHK
ncbi:MAG: hypothetical protein KDG51_18045 [Calditrichaeota bacterium]|nr:hypothetical protein [Calditrichota bacterium]